MQVSPNVFASLRCSDALNISTSAPRRAEYICPETNWRPKQDVWRNSIIGLGCAIGILLAGNAFCVAYWLRDRDRRNRVQDEVISQAHDMAGAAAGAGGAKGTGGKGAGHR